MVPPYRDLIGENWDEVLHEFIPRISQARAAFDYQRELTALIARIHDTHARLTSSLNVQPPVGTCYLPVVIRFIENQAVVTDYLGKPPSARDSLLRGDVIESFGGLAVSDLIQQWRPYYSASNEPTLLREIARALPRGLCGPVTVYARRDDGEVDLTVRRVAMFPTLPNANVAHDLPGETFRLLPGGVAYLKLSSAKAAESRKYITGAAGTHGLIIDLRNDPPDFLVFTLGSLLVDKETSFARFTTADLINPGAFHFGQVVSLAPKAPHYPGKIAILVDEVTQSAAEYTAMAFRSSANALVVGSTTAGADGNVSGVSLPGGVSATISGIGVFYPDKRPTQRVGIVPDIEVKPTLAGLRAGKDEVLDAALRAIQLTTPR